MEGASPLHPRCGKLTELQERFPCGSDPVLLGPRCPFSFPWVGTPPGRLLSQFPGLHVAASNLEALSHLLFV